VRLTTEEIRLMAAFQSITGVYPRDCIVDGNLVIFVVDERNVGKAVGKNGVNIKKIAAITGKSIEVVGYAHEPTQFLKNVFHPAHILAVSVVDKNGSRVARVHVDKESARILGGRLERRLRIARMLAKRYFKIDNVVVM